MFRMVRHAGRFSIDYEFDRKIYGSGPKLAGGRGAPYGDHMTDQMITVVITAVATLLAGGLTGIITLASQRMSLKSADRRALLEIQNQDRTRFLEARKEAYAEFLTAADDAAGWLLGEVVDRRRAAGFPSNWTRPPGVGGDGQFGPAAGMRLTRQCSVVRMLTGSPGVAEASKGVVEAVYQFRHLQPVLESWDDAVRALLRQRDEACARFIEAANRELAGQGGAALTKRDDPKHPTDR
jgi:hypothetical protein